MGSNNSSSAFIDLDHRFGSFVLARFLSRRYRAGKYFYRWLSFTASLLNFNKNDADFLVSLSSFSMSEQRERILSKAERRLLLIKRREKEHRPMRDKLRDV